MGRVSAKRNPTDQFRKILRLREKEKNKQTRKLVREVTAKRKDPLQLKEQVDKYNDLERSGKLDHNARARKKQLEEQLHKLIEHRKTQGEELDFLALKLRRDAERQLAVTRLGLTGDAAREYKLPQEEEEQDDEEALPDLPLEELPDLPSEGDDNEDEEPPLPDDDENEEEQDKTDPPPKQQQQPPPTSAPLLHQAPPPPPPAPAPLPWQQPAPQFLPPNFRPPSVPPPFFFAPPNGGMMMPIPYVPGMMPPPPPRPQGNDGFPMFPMIPTAPFLPLPVPVASNQAPKTAPAITITASAEIKPSSKSTSLVPSAVMRRKGPEPPKIIPKKPTPAVAKPTPTAKTTTTKSNAKDDAYDAFMKELDGLL